MSRQTTETRRSMILDVVVRSEFHVLLVVSIYLLFAGHNQPGGGFVGGLVAGSACALRMVASGPQELRRSIRIRPMTLLGLGLTTAAGAALAGLWNGGQLLETRYLSVDVPFIGPVGTSTAFFFDLGVYLVVLGTVLIVLEALGSPEEELQ
ncbi:MAG TPA: MnhB domain-containing protein [Acidimicrobiales bacterium]